MRSGVTMEFNSLSYKEEIHEELYMKLQKCINNMFLRHLKNCYRMEMLKTNDHNRTNMSSVTFCFMIIFLVNQLAVI